MSRLRRNPWSPGGLNIVVNPQINTAVGLNAVAGAARQHHQNLGQASQQQPLRIPEVGSTRGEQRFPGDPGRE
jgi:hypothetical protein